VELIQLWAKLVFLSWRIYFLSTRSCLAFLSLAARLAVLASRQRR